MIKIPRGKTFKLIVNGEDIMKRPGIASGLSLTIDEDISLNLSSSFEPLWGGSGNKLVNIIGGVSQELFGRGFSSQFKQFGFQMWKSSDPVSFSPTFTFYLGKAGEWNALTEVVNPIFEIANLCLPDEGPGGVLVAPGPTIISLLKGDKEEEEATVGRRVRAEIGGLVNFKAVVVKRAEPTFSKEVDSAGNPVSGKIQLELSTLFNATTNMFTQRF